MKHIVTYMAVQDKILRKKGKEREDICYENCDVSYFYVKKKLEEVDEQTSSGGYEIQLLNQYLRNTS